MIKKKYRLETDVEISEIKIHTVTRGVKFPPHGLMIRETDEDAVYIPLEVWRKIIKDFSLKKIGNQR